MSDAVTTGFKVVWVSIHMHNLRCQTALQYRSVVQISSNKQLPGYFAAFKHDECKLWIHWSTRLCRTRRIKPFFCMPWYCSSRCLQKPLTYGNALSKNKDAVAEKRSAVINHSFKEITKFKKWNQRKRIRHYISKIKCTIMYVLVYRAFVLVLRKSKNLKSFLKNVKNSCRFLKYALELFIFRSLV